VVPGSNLGLNVGLTD